MEEHPYHRLYNLLVDRCPQGHGMYLEAGELRRALEIT
jgi:Zn-finger nucleic acid-binding protein